MLGGAEGDGFKRLMATFESARILNIFEGAAEIQAQMIARGLLERRN